jgi:hypothetical protein
MGKEHVNLIPTCKMGIYYVKIGFRILTKTFTNTALKKHGGSFSTVFFAFHWIMDPAIPNFLDIFLNPGCIFLNF